jgi:hypothetical protein
MSDIPLHSVSRTHRNRAYTPLNQAPATGHADMNTPALDRHPQSLPSRRNIGIARKSKSRYTDEPEEEANLLDEEQDEGTFPHDEAQPPETNAPRVSATAHPLSICVLFKKGFFHTFAFGQKGKGQV